MKLPGDLCNNFNPHRCFKRIPAASFAGFDYHCLSALPSQLVREISAEQFAYLTPDSLIGFECHQLIGELHANIFPIISPAQMNGFVGDACCFIDFRMHTLKDETIHAIDAHCLENAAYNAFQNITSQQFNQLPTDSLHAIDSYHIAYGNASLWQRLSVDQLINLGQSAWTGFSLKHELRNLIVQHGKPLINELTADQVADVFCA